MPILKYGVAVLLVGSACLAQVNMGTCRAFPEIAQALAALPSAENTELTWEQRIG